MVLERSGTGAGVPPFFSLLFSLFSASVASQLCLVPYALKSGCPALNSSFLIPHFSFCGQRPQQATGNC